MKNALRSTILLLCVFMLASFSSKSESDVSGVYGVCGVEVTIVELSLNADHTYSYIDRSNSLAPIELTGTWEEKGNHIELSSNSDHKFHNKWKISNDGTVAKSRKGMSFYRLGRIDK